MYLLKKWRLAEGLTTRVTSNFLNLGFIQASNMVIQVLVFSLIARKVGLEAFGKVMLANACAGIAGIFVNYGSNQSGIRDIAQSQTHVDRLSAHFFTVYASRMVLFLLPATLAVLLYSLHYPYSYSLLLALPLVFAEVLNPLFFFTGLQKLAVYNAANLLARGSAALLILFFVTGAEQAPWTNFYLGIAPCICYALLFVYATRRHRLHTTGIGGGAVRHFLYNNFFLAANNLSVQFQQSIFLFFLSQSAAPLVLGAFALVDKVVWICRIVIIAFSTAIFPGAAMGYQENPLAWPPYKRKINSLLALFFLAAGIVMYFMAPFICLVLTGLTEPTTIFYLRCVAFVPLVMALNALNVLQLLMENRYRRIFGIALLMLAVASITGFAFSRYVAPRWYGGYFFIIESCNLLAYLLSIWLVKHQNKQS